MPNYNQSTLDRIGSITTGVHVKTGVLNNATYLAHNVASGAHNLFNVYGRIRILGLDCEAVTEFAADATLLKWRFEATTPVVGVSDISAVSLSIASIPIGAKVVWLGTAVNTAPDVESTQATISAPAIETMDVGHTGTVAAPGVGIISKTATTAAQGSGTCRFNLYYLPISEGAYVETIAAVA
jgi:hypothetical protein